MYPCNNAQPAIGASQHSFLGVLGEWRFPLLELARGAAYMLKKRNQKRRLEWGITARRGVSRD